MKLTRLQFIEIANALQMVQEPKDDLFTAKFKILLVKNQKLVEEDYKIIVKVLVDKLDEIHKKRIEIDTEYCQLVGEKKERKYQNLKPFTNIDGKPTFTSFYGCVQWPNFIPLVELEEKYGHELKILFEDNTSIFEELREFMNDKIGINFLNFEEAKYPNTISLELTKKLLPLIKDSDECK